MRKLFFTGLALCIIGFAMTANAAVFNYAAEKYRFTWTDSTGVEHSNLLTDKATDPDHILALIAKVYATPEIPGTIYSNEIKKTGKINYDHHASQTESITSSAPTKYLDWLESYDKPISAPSENGKTVLFVEIKPTFHAKGGMWQGVDIKSNRDFVKYCYKSVQLLSSHMRVNDTNNPGYMFVVDNITTNRFFFISKGRARADAGNYPLWTSFEQVSPTRGSDATVTTGLADCLKNGSVYKAIHSCGSVPIIEQGHEFTITGNSELNAFSNLTLYMPDKRLVQDNSYSTYAYSIYDPTYAPRTFLYLCTLDADVKPSENQHGYFTISLKWSTNFNTTKIGAQAEEQYYVYVVNDDGTYTLLHESDATMQTPTQSKTHTYEVPQESDSRILRYIVTANPIEKSGTDVNASTIFIKSNVAQVQIPGKQAFFAQASEYRSRFDISKELNVYKNTIAIKPNTQGDYEKIETTKDYLMMRKYTDADGNAQEVAIASLAFTKNTDGTYNYSINYNASAQNTDVKYDDNAPSTSEAITGTLASTDGVINFYDYFNSSTKSNAQPSEYSYVLELDGAQTSNGGTVPVYKTTASSHLVSVTKEQVQSDNNRGLDATAGGLAVEFKGYIDVDQHIKRYDVYRLDSEPVNVGNAQCENGYITLIKGSQEIAKQQPGTEGYTFSLPDELSNSPMSPATYVPAITTKVTFAGETVTNTYGCSRTAVDAPNLKFVVDNLAVSANKWVDANGHKRRGYGATIHLTPVLPPTTAPYAYYYRVWRSTSDGEVLLDDLSNNDWADYDGIKSFYPGNTEIQVKDVYVANMPNADESRIVTYIARLYSTDQAQSHPAVPRKAASASGTAAGHYYITEKRIDVDYSSSAVATGIDGITTAQATPVSEVYYNVMGVASTRPHPGMNVVVTTLSDGSRLTTKMMK